MTHIMTIIEETFFGDFGLWRHKNVRGFDGVVVKIYYITYMQWAR